VFFFVDTLWNLENILVFPHVYSAARNILTARGDSWGEAWKGKPQHFQSRIILKSVLDLVVNLVII